MTDSLSRSLFVGRERELRTLLDALDAALAGRGSLFLIGGEPGIGKSRLADELAFHARARGVLVLWGRGWEDAGAPPFWPWVQALRSYLRATDADDLRRQLGTGAGDIAQMLPELRDVLPNLPPPPVADADSARFRLFDSTVRLLGEAARARPMVLVIDDLQAADRPSVLLLGFLASQLADMPLLVVATYRDVDLTPLHPLGSAIDEMAREPGTRILTLTGLTRDAVDRFILQRAGHTPNDRLVAAIWRETTGNPLFVGEAIRLLSAEGHLDTIDDVPSLRVAVPASIRAVIARRIGHLDPATANALGLAAALGPEFSLDILRRIGDYGPEEVLGLVNDAIAAGLIMPVAGVLGRYRFSHDLVRETLDDDLSPVPRARLHRRIAEVLESTYGASSDRHLAELAFHYFEAVRGGDGGLAQGSGDGAGLKAVAYARQAGDQAARSLAYEEADRLYAMALSAIGSFDAPDEEVRTDIFLALGEVRARAGDLAGARATYLQAAEAARRTGAAERLGLAALGYGGRLPWARPGDDQLLIPLLEDALVLLDRADTRVRAQLLTRLACALRSSPDRRDDSDRLSQEAVDLARELDDPLTLSYVLAGRYWAIWWPENLIERHPIAAEMVAVVEALGDGERLIDAHLLLFMDYSENGRMREARTEVDAVTRLVDDLRQPAQAFLGVAPRALLALHDGDYPLAEELIEQELVGGRQVTTARDNESAGRMHRFLLRREQARVAEELTSVRASVDDFPWYPVHRAALACLLLDLGRQADARMVFDGFAEDRFRAFYHDNEWLLGVCLASEACWLLGDATAAATLYEQLVPFADRHAIGHTEGSIGAVDRYLGLLAATLGRLDAADHHLATAIRINEGMGAKPWAAHCRHDLADVLRTRDGSGDRARATQLDRDAGDSARALGMVALVRRIGMDVDVVHTRLVPGSPILVGTFRREGEYWTVEFGDDAFRIRDAKGMRYLARLLAAPGRELHALELARLVSSTVAAPAIVDPALSTNGFGDTGPILDQEATAAYRSRLIELEEEITEAESWNDAERLSRLQEETQVLTHELTSAFGLGGRTRPSAAPSERARISVTRAIRASLGRIEQQSTALGEHFDVTIRTGTFCSYSPDPRAPFDWRL